jgi:hypothetical protein
LVGTTNSATQPAPSASNISRCGIGNGRPFPPRTLGRWDFRIRLARILVRATASLIGLLCLLEQEIEQNCWRIHSLSFMTRTRPSANALLQGRKSAPQNTHVFEAERQRTAFQLAGRDPATGGENRVSGGTGKTRSIRKLQCYEVGSRAGDGCQNFAHTQRMTNVITRCKSLDRDHAGWGGDHRPPRNAFVHDHQVKRTEFFGPLVHRLDASDDDWMVRISPPQSGRVNAERHLGADGP